MRLRHTIAAFFAGVCTLTGSVDAQDIASRVHETMDVSNSLKDVWAGRYQPSLKERINQELGARSHEGFSRPGHQKTGELIVVFMGSLLGASAGAGIGNAVTDDRRAIYSAAALGAGGGGILGALSVSRRPAVGTTLLGAGAGAIPLMLIAFDNPRGEMGLSGALDVTVAIALPLIGAVVGNAIGQ